MNKIASYLNQHLLGHVVSSQRVRQHFSTDQSPLKYTPELVVHPRQTSDIRKTTRFAWQLSEKGHTLSITARGGGTDKTGAAIGAGVVMSLTGYMNSIFEIDDKQKMVRLQPGASVRSVNDALRTRGLSIPSIVGTSPKSTVGGAVANNSRGPLSVKYGPTAAWVKQLEVVLASGDVLQTERISKRELNKRKGLTTLEGEIYRKIDGLIIDNEKLIQDQIAGDTIDRRGYPAIAEVKRKDGSFDLTPLFVGSQGTLGIISEMIMKAEFLSNSQDIVVATFAGLDEARDAIEAIEKTKPAFAELYSGALFEAAKSRGMLSDAVAEVAPEADGVLLLVGYDEFGERARSRKVRQAVKVLEGLKAKVHTGTGDKAAKLMAIRDVTLALLVTEKDTESALPLFDGVWVPLERLGLFATELAKLAEKHRVSLPLYGSALEGMYSTRPILQLKRVGDKQKVFKLADEYEKLVSSHGGVFVAEDGEGRFKATISYRGLDPEIVALYEAIKKVFDPHNILNPGVKQPTEIKELIAHLRPHNDIAYSEDQVFYE